MKQYLDILKEVLEYGREKGDRTDTGTLSIFDAKFKHDMRKGFPLVTTKFTALRLVFEELMGFLNNDLHMHCLIESNVKIWDGFRLKDTIQREVPLKNHERVEVLKACRPEMVPVWNDMALNREDQIEEGHAWLDSVGIPRTKAVVDHQQGDLNAPYGSGWRDFKTAEGNVDQLSYAVDLLKHNPDSRRILVSAWNPGWMPEETRQVELGFMERDALFEELYPDLYADSQETLNYPEIAGDLDMARMHMDDAGVPTHKTVKVTPQENIVNGKPCLTPCHWAFEFYTEEMTLHERSWWAREYDNATYLKVCAVSDSLPDQHDQMRALLDEAGTPVRFISLKWHQRSCDMFLGIPFNIASYALLLEMIAEHVGMVPYMLVGDLTNVHVYKNHLEQVKLQLTRDPKPLPRLKFKGVPDRFEDYRWEDIDLIDYVYHPKITGEIAI